MGVVGGEEKAVVHVELIEELKLRGGGKGLFTGCAAGDLGMAVVIAVDERPANG